MMADTRLKTVCFISNNFKLYVIQSRQIHSSVSRYFEGRQLVFRATRPVAPGAVVSENYGPHFLSRGLKERQRALASRYWFKCNCRACELDWPQLKQMTSAVLYK